MGNAMRSPNYLLEPDEELYCSVRATRRFVQIHSSEDDPTTIDEESRAMGYGWKIKQGLEDRLNGTAIPLTTI